jgi:hypothetical protein
VAVSSLRARASHGTHAQRLSRALVLLASIALVFVSSAAFVAVHHEAHVAAVKAAVGRVAVMATVVAAPGLIDPGYAPCATVRFCTPDGKAHEATVAMNPAIRPGEQVPLWVTPAGALTSAPSSASPLRRSLTGWVGAACLAATAVAACALLARRWAARHDARVFDTIVAPLRAEERSWDRADF